MATVLRQCVAAMQGNIAATWLFRAVRRKMHSGRCHTFANSSQRCTRLKMPVLEGDCKKIGAVLPQRLVSCLGTESWLLSETQRREVTQ
jgi:hypothetical protein